MTREDFLARYGDQLVVFDSYYKYIFTFIDTTLSNERHLTVSFGGDSSDVYKFAIDAKKPRRIRDIEREVNMYSANRLDDFDEYWGIY